MVISLDLDIMIERKSLSATSVTLELPGADFDDETFQVARSMHAPVAENQMQFFIKKGVDNLIPIQKSFAQLLVISNVLNAINPQFRFDLVILNETQSLECESMSMFQVYRMILPMSIPLKLLQLGRRLIGVRLLRNILFLFFSLISQ